MSYTAYDTGPAAPAPSYPPMIVPETRVERDAVRYIVHGASRGGRRAHLLAAIRENRRAGRAARARRFLSWAIWVGYPSK